MYRLMNELKQENLLLIRRLEESERKRENSFQETLKATQPLVKELEEKSTILKTLEHDFEKREQIHLKTIGKYSIKYLIKKNIKYIFTFLYYRLFIIYLDELQTLINNTEHKIKLMDSKLQECNNFEKKCKDQIENLLQNDSDLKIKFEKLKEENAALKLNSNRFGIKII